MVTKLEPCPSRDVSAACATLMLGVILVSCGAGGKVGALAVGITLLSALFSACHVITIRRAMTTMIKSARVEVPTAEQGWEGADAGEKAGLLTHPECLSEDSRWQRSGNKVSAATCNSDRYHQQATEQSHDKLPSARVPELLMLKMVLSMVFLVPAAMLEHIQLTGASDDGVTAWTVLAATPDVRRRSIVVLHLAALL